MIGTIALLSALLMGQVPPRASAPERPIHFASRREAARGPVIALDLRWQTKVPSSQDPISCLDISETLASRNLEFGTDEWFEAIPDSMKATATSSTTGIYVRALTGPDADVIRIVILPGFADPSVERRVAKPNGIEDVTYRWDLRDGNGQRVPPGYYGVRLERDRRGQVGFVHVLQ